MTSSLSYWSVKVKYFEFHSAAAGKSASASEHVLCVIVRVRLVDVLFAYVRLTVYVGCYALVEVQHFVHKDQLNSRLIIVFIRLVLM